MSYSDLLERMMHRDTDAFLEMTDRYGWALYSTIRSVYPDKTEADTIYHETMHQFYQSLQNPTCEDPLEALLCALADHVAYRKGFDMALSDTDPLDPSEPPPEVKIRKLVEMQAAVPQRNKNWFAVIFVGTLLAAALLMSIWIIIGFLMHQGVLPFIDLGYSVFCAFVEECFAQLNLF